MTNETYDDEIDETNVVLYEKIAEKLIYNCIEKKTDSGFWVDADTIIEILESEVRQDAST